MNIWYRMYLLYTRARNFSRKYSRVLKIILPLLMIRTMNDEASV